MQEASLAARVRAGAVVLAAGLSLAAPGAAQAQQDVVTCAIDFATLTGTAQAGSGAFGGSTANATCAHDSPGRGGQYGGADATVSGTWSSGSCGTGRLTGQMTIDSFRPIDVDFDVPTTGGQGTASVHATNEEGATGTGGIVLSETMTQEACPQPLDEPIPIDVGPVQGEIGGDRGLAWRLTATVRFEIP